MRNLKKALCLTLACVMLLGMMVVGVGASYEDFTDEKDITHKEAVATLVELGLIAGKEDGSYFDPTGIITRYEMCKLIAVGLNGGREPAIGTKDVPTYGDIKGEWGERYVEYCSTLGIVAGDGAGNFNGTKTVTGSEAAKMLLCALGYKADVEGYVGASWEINTGVRASMLDLYDEIENVNASAGLTRDSAAQMVNNTLSCKEVFYNNAVTIGGVTIGNSQLEERSYTWLEYRFGVTKFEGVIIANEYGNVEGASPLKAGNTEIRYDTVDKDKNPISATATVKAVTTYDLIGKKVTIYAKELKNGVYQKVYGAPIVSTVNSVFTATKGYANSTSGLNSLTSDLSKAGIKSINAGVMINGVQDGTWDNTIPAAPVWVPTVVTTIGALRNLTGNGVAITVINNDDDDTQADYIIIRKLSVGEVTAYSKTGNNGDGYVTVSPKGGATGFSAEKFENVVGYESVAKDDIVLYYELDGKYHVQVAEMLTVAVDKINGSDVVSGSTTYKPSALNSAVDMTTLATSEDAELYLDEYGYVVYSDGVENTLHYLFVTNAQPYSGGAVWTDAKIKAILEDGTSVSANVYSINGKKCTDSGATQPAKETVYTYTVREDGSGYALKTVTGGILPVSGSEVPLTVTKSKTAVGGKTANAKTIFLIKNTNDDWFSYTGISNVPSTDGTNSLIYCKSGTTATFVVITGATTTGSTGKNIYLLNTKVIRGGSSSDPTYFVNALVDGVKKELEVDGAITAAELTVGLYKNVTLNSDSSIAVGDLASQTPDRVANEVTICKDGVIANADDSFTFDSTTKVMTIDGTTVSNPEDTSIDEVVCIDGGTNNSKIVLVPGKDSDTENTAAWVFIVK